MKLNGQNISLTEQVPLLKFLEHKGYDIKKIAVELNGSIVAKADYSCTMLHEEDLLEVVSFIGGG
jgi:sulfur carrier protein